MSKGGRFWVKEKGKQVGSDVSKDGGGGTGNIVEV